MSKNNISQKTHYHIPSALGYNYAHSLIFESAIEFFLGENRACHYRILKQCPINGLILKKIHSVLKFEQDPFLKPYIDLNTRLPTEATNLFEKDFYKLLINSIYGKTLEKVCY